MCLCGCVYLQWHSCCTGPGQVVGSPAGSHTRLLASLGFSHICLGCRSNSWLNSSYFSCSVFPVSRGCWPIGGLTEFGLLAAKLHLETVCPSTQRPLSCFVFFSAYWRNLISKTIGHCALCVQLILEPIASSTNGLDHVWLGQCTVAGLPFMTLSKCEGLSHCML